MAEITYTMVGDVLLPDLEIDPEPEGTVGKWGLMRLDYIKKYDKWLYNHLFLENELKQHLLDIDEQAMEMMDELVPKFQKAEGLTEEMKDTDPMHWVGVTNNCIARAEEIVKAELIFVQI